MDVDEKTLLELAEKIFYAAEPPMKEYASSKLLQDYLRKADFKVEVGVADMPTAFVATWGKGSPVIGFLAEFDALEGLSQKPVPYKDPIEANAAGHGCGHNLFGVASAGGAVAMKKAMEREKSAGTIKVFGTPAEEICVGKPYMAKAGLFNGLDAIFVWHPEYETSAGYGAALAYDSIKFSFKGQAAYGAQPWMARSALDAVILMEVIVNFLKEHMVEPEARPTVNSIIKSGEAPSVIPAAAEIWYVFRTMTRAYSERIYEHLLRAAKAAALATGTEVDVFRVTGCHQQIPNKTISEAMHQFLLEVGPPQFTAEEQAFAKKIQREYGVKELGLDATIKEPYQQGAFYADDRSEPSWFAPMAALHMANWPLGVPAHSWGAVAVSGHSIGYKCMLVAAKVFSKTALYLIQQPEILKKAREELEERTVRQGFVFKSPIPDGQKPPWPKAETITQTSKTQ